MKTKARTEQKTNQNQAGTQRTQSVQERAYELYLQRGQETGRELEDWVQAEREMDGQNPERT